MNIQDPFLAKIQSLQQSLTLLEQKQTLSYHQTNQLNLMQCYSKYFQNLKQSHIKNPSSKLHNKLLHQYSLLGNSLWSYCGEILPFINSQSKAKHNQHQLTTNSFIILSHLHYQSQAPHLAVFLKNMGHQVELWGSKKQVGWGWMQSVVRMQEVDKKGAFTKLMKDQGIQINYYQDPLDGNSTTTNSSQTIKVIDLFNTHPTIYKPYLLSNPPLSSSSCPTIIYIHPSQHEQINNLLDQLNKTKPNVIELQAQVRYPYEMSTFSSNKLQDQIFQFLNEEINHPNKQDIIIFHEPTQQFIKQLTNIFKKKDNDLSKNIKIITKPNESQKLSLPPTPIFINLASTQGYSSIEPSTNASNSQIKSAISDSSISIKKQEGRSSHTHNNIFIVPNFKTLCQWQYDISHVFLIFDYMTDEFFYYNYEFMNYVHHKKNYISYNQMQMRISCMGIAKVGKYLSIQQGEMQRQQQTQKQIFGIDGKVKDIGLFCLEMIIAKKGLLSKYLESPQIKSCLKALENQKIIEVQNQTYKIVNQLILQYLRKARSLNPILCSYILSAKTTSNPLIPSQKLALLLAMTASIMMTQNSLKLNSSLNNRPTLIWRQTGYLHSALDVLVRVKILQQREGEGKRVSKKSVSKSKKISKQTSQQYEIFGDLFDILVADRLTFDQMTVEDLLRQQIVNQTVFHKIVDTTQKICDVLNLQDATFTSFDNMNQILSELTKNHNKSIGVYSGSRRIGYFVQGQQNGLFPSKESLLSILNQRPSFVYISRLEIEENVDLERKYEILMCNTVSQTTVLQSSGSLPVRKTQSTGETQFQYHGIPSGTFSHLWRNNGIDIEAFQDKNGCFIQPNQQLALISIHCPKQKQSQIRQQFDMVLTKVKEKMQAETKIHHYLGTTSLLLGAGGKVVQAIKDKYINKCLLSNLDLSVQVQDLYQLFQQFFNLKDIKIIKDANYKSAFIEFQSQKDYYRFYQYYNECLYLNRYIKVSPIESMPALSVFNQEMFLEFVWNAWKSCRKAMIKFQQSEAALKCFESLKIQELDGKKVKAELKNETVVIEQMNPFTDQINLQKAFENYGKISLIQILKTPSKQHFIGIEATLQQQIKKVIGANVDIKVGKTEKLKNGLRKCKVVFKDLNKLNEAITMNQKTGIMGVSRIHILSWFIYPIKIAHGYLPLYQQLIDNTLSKIPNNKIKLENTIFNEQEYIVAKSHMKDELDVFKTKINVELQGYPVDLTTLESTILLTQVGIQNLLDLQEKYVCRLIPDFNNKILAVICKFENMKTIKQEIKAKVQDNFFYRIPLNQKSFKNFKQNPKTLQTMKEQYHLTYLELEQVGKNLLLQGSANNVEKVFNYLMHLVQSYSKINEQQILNMDVCGICCQQPFRPYRLQQCGHKFCLTCLLDNANNSLGDISMFPIKCPQCLMQLTINDLNELLTKQMWAKLTNIALNQYTGRNSDTITGCYTAGCKQVNFILKDHFKCDECGQSYCLGCKLNYHPGLTCQQAKSGGNAAFQKYMKQNGIRKCPNPTCKMPIMRLDGCYRVTCSRCDKSMCFKCQPEKMIAYNHYNDCYAHLTQAHGGYW